MNTKGFKQMLIGEKMPDKDDPKYKERYERDVRAGRKFAKMCRIDKAAAKVEVCRLAQDTVPGHRVRFCRCEFQFQHLSHGKSLSLSGRATHCYGETGLADKGSPSEYGECKEHSKDQ